MSLRVCVFGNLSKKITEHVYYKDESIGTVELEVGITKIPLLKQIQCGIHTERGFDISSNYIISSSTTGSGSEPEELINLQNVYSVLMKKLAEYSGIKTAIHIREHKAEIKGCLSKLKSLLEISVKETCLIYRYESSDDILKAQQIMLDMGSNIVSFFETVNLEIKGIMLEIIQLICRRAELELEWIVLEEDQLYKDSEGPDNSQEETIKLKHIVDKKVSIASQLVELMISLLEYSLVNIGRKVQDECSKSFNEFFFSFCYFRLYGFIDEFLGAISQGLISLDNNYNLNSGHDEAELKGANLIINPVNSLLDWNTLFYDQYRQFKEFDLESKQARIMKLLDSKSWKEVLTRRGPTFISIVFQIRNYIKQKIVLSKNIRWQDLPGFRVIIESIFNDLIKRDVKHISNGLIDLMKGFVNDSSILNRFISIIVNRTCLYEVSSVLKVFDVLHAFFQEYKDNLQISAFGIKADYNLMWKACKLIFEADHHICISKVLWFVYHNSHLFNVESFFCLVQPILNRWFFILFFHWSFQVRNLFYYFLLFILQHKLKLNFEKCFISTDISNKRSRRSILIEKLDVKDELGFMTAVKKDYLNNIKNAILKEYYNQMRVINKIINVVKKYSSSNWAEAVSAVEVEQVDFKGDLKVKFNSIQESSTSTEVNAFEATIEKQTLKTPKIMTKVIGENISPLKPVCCDIKKSNESLVTALLSDYDIKSRISDIQVDYIKQGVYQYNDMNSQFKLWSKEVEEFGQTSATQCVFYPNIEFHQVKDDVNDYSN